MGDEFHSRLLEAERRLSESDSVLRSVIERVGHCKLMPHSNYYEELIRSIVGQQLSIKAAATIVGRFKDLGDGNFPVPEKVVSIPDEQMRAVGLSRAKISYVKDIAEHVIDGRLEFDKFSEMTNDEIIAELTDVKGIGEWTAHMFLIFSLGRLDVLPTGDLGIRKGVQTLYGLYTLPGDVDIRRIAEQNRWTGNESVAAWYIWKSID